MKIGILTFHRCINYGSFWQAYCLAEGLKARGHTVELLDHYSRKVNIAEWKCAYQPVLPTPVPASDQAAYRKKIRGFFRTFESYTVSPCFDLHQPQDAGNFDVVAVGSDEVWNLFHPWYGRCPLFFGDGIRTKRLISYAASFGNYDASFGLEDQWKMKLQQFQYISVRDENSQHIIEKATGAKPPLVLDPCLQFPADPEQQTGERFSKKYIAVYGHNFSNWFAGHISSYAKKSNLRIISIGYRNDWAQEQWIDADPHQFAHFIIGAEAVATNFFHGCVFSLRYKKPFVCEASPYRINKLKGLVTKTQSEGHLVNADTTAAIYSQYLQYPLSSMISERVSCLREASNEYLEYALNLKKPDPHEKIVCTG